MDMIIKKNKCAPLGIYINGKTIETFISEPYSEYTTSYGPGPYGRCPVYHRSIKMVYKGIYSEVKRDLDSLEESVFIQYFKEPLTDQKRWEVVYCPNNRSGWSEELAIICDFCQYMLLNKQIYEKLSDADKEKYTKIIKSIIKEEKVGNGDEEEIEYSINSCSPKDLGISKEEFLYMKNFGLVKRLDDRLPGELKNSEMIFNPEEYIAQFVEKTKGEEESSKTNEKE